MLKERVGEHPNMVRLLEVFFEEPPYYLEMEYVAGRDLKTWSEERGRDGMLPSQTSGTAIRDPSQNERGWVDQIPLETRLEIVAQVADALQAAHDAGVIHRDVKPSNILVAADVSRRADSMECGGLTPLSSEDHSESMERIQSAVKPGNILASGTVECGGLTPLSNAGPKEVTRTPGTSESIQSAVKPAHSRIQVKLTDFGIGQVVSAEALAGITRLGFTETMLSPGRGTQAGTYLYMAPELMAARPASKQSDIYSLGVVLYQLLVGDFSRPITTDWAKEIEDPVLREDVAKCIAGRREDRFQSVAALARNLRSLE